MREPSDPEPTGLPLVAQLPIDVACDRFEAAWREGLRPRVEDFLGEAQGRELATLCRELVLLDMYYRRRRGHVCRTEDYRAVLPEPDAPWLAAAQKDADPSADGRTPATSAAAAGGRRPRPGRR
jgi:hypothetical protein